MQVICHIGLHKTASGALQRQFFPACSNLTLFTTQQPDTDRFVRAVTYTDPVYFDAARAKALLQPRLNASDVNLISNESISGPPYGGLIEYGLDHRTPVLSNLRSVFPDAKILIVLRRQDRLARSLYRQYLKRGGTEKIDRFYGLSDSGKPGLMSLDRFRFFPYLELIAEMFPAGLKILLFEDFQSDRERFLKELCEFIGVDDPKIDIRAENATKLGPLGMELSRWANFAFRSMINKGPVPPIPRKQFGRWRLVSPVEYLHDYWPGRGRPSNLVSRVSSRVLAEMQQDNQKTSEKFGLDAGRYDYY